MSDEKRCVFIPPELFEWLEAEAKIRDRTIDSQVVRILEQHRARRAYGLPASEMTYFLHA